MIRTFIVDDEKPARQELERLLKSHLDFEMVGEAADGAEAIDSIQMLNPDVVFLDIHMPKVDGLAVAAEISKMEAPPFIVFVTAFDEHAIKAFEVNAVDYILKPYDQHRLDKACQKIRNALRDKALIKERLSKFGRFLEEEKTLKILGRYRKSNERVFIHLQEVLYFHVRLTDVSAYLINGQELLVNVTLKSLLKTLKPDQFQQVHRSYIVNLDQVEKVSPLFSGNYDLLLKGVSGVHIPLSRRYARKLKRIMKW